MVLPIQRLGQFIEPARLLKISRLVLFPAVAEDF